MTQRATESLTLAVLGWSGAFCRLYPLEEPESRGDGETDEEVGAPMDVQQAAGVSHGSWLFMVNHQVM